MNLPPFEMCLWFMVVDYLPRLTPGECLPNYHKMAALIGVSELTYRECARVLEYHGVIEVSQGKRVKFVSLNKPGLMFVMKEKGLLTGRTS